MGKRELVALLNLSAWCFVVVVWLFLAVPWVSLQFVIVVFPDHTHFLFWIQWLAPREKVLKVMKNCMSSSQGCLSYGGVNLNTFMKLLLSGWC